MEIRHLSTTGRASVQVAANVIIQFDLKLHWAQGDRCNHAHGDADLRPVIPSRQKTPVREKGSVKGLGRERP